MANDMLTGHTPPPIGGPTATLSDGMIIPRLGFGTWELSEDEAYASVRTAISAGFRRIDTAMIYKNEESTGKAIRDAITEGEITREELTVSTKLWNADQGYRSAIDAFNTSVNKLGLDYIDIYFIHWPCPEKNQYNESFRAMTELKNRGRVRSVAVCNFYPEVLDDLVAESSAMPTINQIELHPGFSQQAMRSYDDQHSMLTESWSPLARGAYFDEPVIQELASKYGKTPAQIVLRWHLDLGLSVLTRSKSRDHVQSNVDIFDFSLTDAEVESVTALDREDGRIGPDPSTANFE
ncbi:aldo/keto reductase [Corynebacterium kroppenstedtii]|uniref:aldo/keto reductase n=1 Tax=Corynebacterium sp. PCR 32 TaxID=3351342 RepID=UPI003095D8A2